MPTKPVPVSGSSFRPARHFDWGVDAPLPKPILPEATKTKTKRHHRRRRRAKKKFVDWLRGVIREELIDRVEEAVQLGTIDLHNDFASVPAIEITGGELALLLRILFPEEYPDPLRTTRPAPTTTAPGSPARQLDYRERAAAGLPLFSKADADPVWNDRLRPCGRMKLNGAGYEVSGWEGDQVDEGSDDG